MKLYGISQSTGVERELKVELGGNGVVLTISDHDGNKERERIMVQPDELLSAFMNPPPGGSTVEGIAPPNGPAMQLHIEIRRNEVQLRAGVGTGKGTDVAVGLDDFQDALEGVISKK